MSASYLSSFSSFSPSSTRPHLPFVAAAMAPLFFAFLIQRAGLDFLMACSASLATLLAFTGFMLWLHVLRSAWSKLFPVRYPLPAASAIALGRLPEEKFSMAETLQALGNLKYNGPLDIVLAVSIDLLRPAGLESEEEIISMAAKIPFHVSVCRVSESSSEEETLLSALELASGKIVAVFHAGHCPKPEAMAVAAQWGGKKEHVSLQERMDCEGRTWDVQEISVGAASTTLSSIQKFFQSLCQLADGGKGWYGALWRFVPWAVVQMVPLSVLLSMVQIGLPVLSGFPSSSTSRIATSLVLSSSY